ncbi:MAG: hypothetical protein HOI66_21405 [Verrucomicrobia bacterium]|jgi:hypothetical protein|nr:hypothetical protein [Verrucomicrobiota bacterium]MDA7645185.1 hypothetical protein [bacterium]
MRKKIGNLYRELLLFLAILGMTGCHGMPTGMERLPTHRAVSKVDASSPGGQVVDGLQVHLWTEKQDWVRAEIPVFKADALVVGPGRLGFLDPPMGVFLEYDGVEYGVVGAGALSMGGPPVRGSIYGLSGNLEGDRYEDSEGAPLILGPGEHTLRLVMLAYPVDRQTSDLTFVYSNEVGIAVAAD